MMMAGHLDVEPMHIDSLLFHKHCLCGKLLWGKARFWMVGPRCLRDAGQKLLSWHIGCDA